MNTLKVYVLPVSGGCFVSQLGLMSELYVANKMSKKGILNGSQDYQPDICLCASGGNVSAYVGLAADWSDTGIYRIARFLRSEIFVKSWLPKELNFIPSWLIGTFNGSIYKQGTGGKALFNELFTSKTVKRVEIWTGTYDKHNSKSQFFCNLDRGESLINPIFFHEDECLFSCMPLEYLHGDLNKIAEVSVASASIPFLVEEQVHNGIGYADGGVMYPSPVSAMSSEICRLIENKSEKTNTYEISENEIYEPGLTPQYSKKLRLVYFSPYQFEMASNYNITKKNKTGILIETLEKLLYSSIIQDKNNCLNILRRIAGDKQHLIKKSYYYDLNTLKLSQILTEIETYTHYVLILFPKGSIEISLLNIKESELINSIEKSRINFGASIWYLK